MTTIAHPDSPLAAKIRALCASTDPVERARGVQAAAHFGVELAPTVPCSACNGTGRVPEAAA